MYKYNLDLRNASRELDKEYPGADFDDSLLKYLELKRTIASKKERFIKIVFSLVFYLLTSFLVHLKFDTPIHVSMVYGLLWFLTLYLIKHYWRKKYE